MEGEKNFQTSNASGGEGDIQRRQQQRHKLDAYKQRVHTFQEFINNKARARWVTLFLLMDIFSNLFQWRSLTSRQWIIVARPSSTAYRALSRI
jgi:hypothetical protein